MYTTARFLASRFLIALISASLLAACGVPVGAQEVTATPLAEADSFLTSSGVTTRLRTTVSDTEAWSTLWERLTRGDSSLPALPAADFNRETLIVAAKGTCPAGICSIQITGVYEKDGSLYAVVRETSPGKGKGCVLPQIVTYPLAIVRVDAVGMPVIFVEKQATTNCY